jgi:hypothetical protein
MVYPLCPSHYCGTCALKHPMEATSQWRSLDPCPNCQHVECYNSTWGRENFFKGITLTESTVSADVFF